jgi:hypothetical protein
MKSNTQFNLFLLVITAFMAAGYFVHNQFAGGFISGFSGSLLVFTTVGRWQAKKAMNQFSNVLKNKQKLIKGINQIKK